VLVSGKGNLAFVEVLFFFFLRGFVEGFYIYEEG